MGKSVGKKVALALIAACTCCSATSKGSFNEKRKVMTDAPPELTEVINAKPGIWPNCRSKGAVTDAVITCGLAPGYKVLTCMVG